MTGDSEKKVEVETAAHQKKAEENGEATSEPITEYRFAVKPVERHGWDAVSYFMWNPESKEFMGRTGMSWLKIGVFYLVYYTFLAAFFLLMLLIFFTTLHDRKPTYSVDASIIGSNPGVGYRPRPSDNEIASTLIWYRHGVANGNWNTTGGWVQRLEQDLSPYKDQKNHQTNDGRTDGKMFTECGQFGKDIPGPGQLCEINSDELFQGRCTQESGYGFGDAKPCILIKLNKIYKWEPTPYTEESQMPDNIPSSIKEEFRKNVADNKPELNNRVWLDCRGENPGDRENLGSINYYPYQGFSANYYPYENQQGYLSPIVFAQLENPKKGVMIAIECKAWDQKLEHDSMDRRGLVHFELMID